MEGGGAKKMRLRQENFKNWFELENPKKTGARLSDLHFTQYFTISTAKAKKG